MADWRKTLGWTATAIGGLLLLAKGLKTLIVLRQALYDPHSVSNSHDPKVIADVFKMPEIRELW